ncbi:MAG: T9SS C-terminal target domain-containing protein, partial [Ignavibacteriae bacterium]
HGSIRISDICEEGGTRLYVSNNATYSLSCRPNPASSTVNIVYGLAGSASVTIEILSFTGEVVNVPLQDVAVQSGLYTLPVDISQFGDGVYIVQLRTRVATLTSLMTVQK